MPQWLLWAEKSGDHVPLHLPRVVPQHTAGDCSMSNPPGGKTAVSGRWYTKQESSWELVE